jgi:peptide deformylase
MLKIVKWPDPILEQAAGPVTEFDKELEELVNEMFETMYAHDGLGLAAPQVGVSKSIFVIDFQVEGKRGVLINPVITGFSLNDGKMVEPEEGCLSLPDVLVKTKRYKDVGVEYQTVDGKPGYEIFKDLSSIAVQHEIDHLKGYTILGFMSEVKRNLTEKKLKKRK